MNRETMGRRAREREDLRRKKIEDGKKLTLTERVGLGIMAVSLITALPVAIDLHKQATKIDREELYYSSGSEMTKYNVLGAIYIGHVICFSIGAFYAAFGESILKKDK